MAKFSVIVPAAGSGERFGTGANKIFQRIKGQPLFIRTLEAFTNRDDVCQILLTVSSDDIEAMSADWGGHLGFLGVSIIPGGATRAESVRNALAKVSDDADYVCVHDGARPCISGVWVDAVFKEAVKTGAAILAYPVHGTLKHVGESNIIDGTADRTGLWEAQTPQVFRKDIIAKAYAGELAGATDEAQLVEAIGHPVSVVTGDPRNIKVTTKADLKLAEAVINTLPKPRPKGPNHPFADAQC